MIIVPPKDILKKLVGIDINASKSLANDTSSSSFDSNVTNQMVIPINKTELPKIDCEPGSSETVPIGGKTA